MHHLIKTFKYLTLCVVLAGLAVACQQSSPVSEAPVSDPNPPVQTTQNLNVSATIFPIYDISKQIIGDKGTVELIMAPGNSPHTFEARPSDLIKLNDADVIFAIGQELDNWIVAMAKETSAEVITVDTNIDLIAYEDEHDDHDEHEKDGDHDGHDDHDEHEKDGDHDGHDDH
ncbi:MAG: hypothetical protein CL710_04645, partial [Chloroflexi bacterium]|nr:hypothetical protein [Chloroflexota bacterium]